MHIHIHTHKHKPTKHNLTRQIHCMRYTMTHVCCSHPAPWIYPPLTHCRTLHLRLQRRVRPVQVACSLQTGSQQPVQQTSYQTIPTGPGEMRENAGREEQGEQRDEQSLRQTRYATCWMWCRWPHPRQTVPPRWARGSPHTVGKRMMDGCRHGS